MARSQEEKERRRLEYDERKLARKISKDSQSKNADKSASTTANNNKKKVAIDYRKINPHEANINSLLIRQIPNDSLYNILCYLPSREVGALCLTCRYLRDILDDGRIVHLLSRLRNTNATSNYNDATSSMMCTDEAEARNILMKSLIRVQGDSNKKKGGSRESDQYISYARFIESSVSGYETLGVSGNSNSRTIVLPAVVNGRMASASPEHTLCRIGGGGDTSGAGGSGVCAWGQGKRGQLGNGKREDEKSPYRLRSGIGYGIRIVQVSAGGGLVRVAHSLLLTSMGRVLSFGMAQYGQLGHGYSAGKQLCDVLHPQYIDALSDYRCTCVSAGELHNAVVTDDGDVYTWGDGFCGQLGLGDKRPQMLPRQVVLGGLEEECVASVSCGARHTLCVTEDGEVFSFGLGYFGVLGRSYTPFEYDSDVAIEGLVDDNGNLQQQQPRPDEVVVQEEAILPNTDTISAAMHALGVTLDDGSDQCYPKLIDSLQGVAHIIGSSAGHRHTMLLDKCGGLYTFGSGLGGALGHGDCIKQEFPLKVQEFANQGIIIRQMSAGVDISMAVSTSGNVYAWGKADQGRIGLGNNNMNVSIPRRVYLPHYDNNKNNPSSDDKAVDVECGYVHSLIISLSGSVYICGGVGVDGANDGAQGDTTGHPVPLDNINIWQHIPEPKDEQKSNEKWKKYGKYEVKGRSQMMSDSDRWNI